MNFESDLEKSLSVLRDGGIILYPTDTIWGIGCDATNSKAVEKIYHLKKRPDHKSMIVLVAEEKEVLQYVAAPDLEVFDYLASSSKPTTVIYNGAIGLADNLLAADGSIGMRICREAFCRHLIKRLRRPIVSTSANISGQAPAANFSLIDPVIVSSVDYVVQYRQDDITPAQASAVIRWDSGRVVVVRP